MEFTLYTADCTGKAVNCLYPHEVKITNRKELAAAIAYDQVFAKYKDSYRNISNFISSSVIPLDCDNDHSENPGDWLTTEKLMDIFDDMQFALIPSRNHMKEKNGKAARPKYHVLFPVAEYTDPAFYAAVKSAIQKKYPFFDDIADSATNEFLKTESNRLYGGSYEYCYTPVLGDPMLYFVSAGNSTTAGFVILTNYLATINNLSEPVTKTADKTMKVTYIIQEQ